MRGKKVWLPVTALVVAAVVLLGIWYLNRPQGQEGEKTIVVEVVHADETAKEFTYHTSEEFLGPVLLSEGLAEGEQSTYGLFITTVDGETAEGNQWWCITRDGQMVETGADTTPIADGDHFELTMSTY